MSWQSYGIIALVAVVCLAGVYTNAQQQTLTYDEYFLLHQVELFKSFDSSRESTQIVLPVVPLLLLLGESMGGVWNAFVYIPALLGGALVALVYITALVLSKNQTASLFASFCAACSPAAWSLIANPLSTAGVILVLLAMVGMVTLQSKGSVWLVIFSILALIFTDAIFVVIIIALVLYVFFIKMEDLQHTIAELELIVFLIFLSSWISLIIFKDAFVLHGTNILAGNAPEAILVARIGTFSIIEALVKIGVFQALLGFGAIYLFLFRRKNKSVYLPVSILLVLLTVWSLRIIDVHYALGLSAVVLCVLASLAFKEGSEYIRKTHFIRWHVPLRILVVLAVAFSLTGVFSQQTSRPSIDDVGAMQWIEINTPSDAVVMAHPREGFLVEQLAKRKPVINTQFLLVDDAKKRYDDSLAVFNPVTSETDAVRTMDEYDVSYLFISEEVQREFGQPLYLSSQRCFERVYDRGAIVFQARCMVRSFG